MLVKLFFISDFYVCPSEGCELSEICSQSISRLVCVCDSQWNNDDCLVDGEFKLNETVKTYNLISIFNERVKHVT